MKNNYFKVGTVAALISPTLGIELCGYAGRTEGSRGIHDNLYAKAIAIDDGENRIAILSCDLIGLDLDFISSFNNLAEKQLAISPRSIMIACSHTHSGPASFHNNGIGLKNKNYMDLLIDKFLEALTEAIASLKEASAYYYQSTCSIGINRRGKIERGSIEPSPDPDGFIDRQVSVIAFYLQDEKPIAVLFNYGCHPTILGYDNLLVSADFPGAACKHIENHFDHNITAVFTNGGAGNINPVMRGSFDAVESNGEDLSKAVIEAIRGEGKKLYPLVKQHSVEVMLPYAAVDSKEEFEKAASEAEYLLKKTSSGFVDEKVYKAIINWANKHLNIAANGGIPNYLQINLQGLMIGDVCLIGIPAEVFSETSAWIKEHSLNNTIVISYANGDIGYLPTAAEILKGGYEVLEAHKYYDRPAHFSGEAEKNIRNASIKLMHELKGNID